MVDASSGSASLISAAQFSVFFERRMASWSLAAAFPVGAARATRDCLRQGCSKTSAKILATVVVFPVPGPPEITQNLFASEVKAAIRCQSISSFPPEIP